MGISLPFSLSKPKIRSSQKNTYTLSRCIGKGLAAHVYEATDESGEVVALKQFRHFHDKNSAFEDEKAIFKALKGRYSKHLVQLLDQRSDPSTFYDMKARFLVFELCDMSLMELVNKPTFDILESPAILHQAIKGVYCLHQARISHGDIHRGNCLVKVGDDEKPILKLADFGCARRVGLNSNNSQVSEAIRDDMFDLAVLFVTLVNKGGRRFLPSWECGKRFSYFLPIFFAEDPKWNSDSFYARLMSLPMESNEIRKQMIKFFRTMQKEEKLHSFLPLLRGLVEPNLSRRITSGTALDMMDEIMETSSVPKTFRISLSKSNARKL